MSDLKFGTEEPTEEEKTAIDELLSEIGPAEIKLDERFVVSGRTRVKDRRRLLLPALHELQNTSGWISPGGLNYACKVLGIPPAEAYGVATFYHLFSHESPEAKDLIHVCDDVACRLFGAETLIEDLKDSGHKVKPSPCLGQCERAPSVLIQRTNKKDLTAVAESNNSLTAVNIEQVLTSETLTPQMTVPQKGSEGLSCLLYTSPSPRDRSLSRMPSSA